MTDQNKDQKPCNQDSTTKTLAEKVRPIQERARQMGVVPDGWDGKAFMDEAWGEDSNPTATPIVVHRTYTKEILSIFQFS